MNKLCITKHGGKGWNYFDISRRLIPPPTLAFNLHMPSIDNLHQIAQTYAAQIGCPTPNFCVVEPHIGPRVMVGHHRNSVTNFILMKQSVEGKLLNQGGEVPRFRRYSDTRVRGQHQAEQCGARAARANYEERSHARLRVRRPLTRTVIYMHAPKETVNYGQPFQRTPVIRRNTAELFRSPS